MEPSKSSHFSIKYDQALGDRLTILGVRLNTALVDMLALAGINHIPSTMTVGYYRRLDEPPGAWCFMPVNTDEAVAVLPSLWVMDRVAYDLRIRTRDIDHTVNGYVSDRRYGRRKIPTKDALVVSTTHHELVKTFNAHDISRLRPKLTIGYFFKLDHPPGAWSFMPVTTKAVEAALKTEKVQEELSKGLVRRILEASRYNTRDSTESTNPTREQGNF